MSFCTKCGAKLDDTMKFCTSCGTVNPSYLAPAVAEAEKVADAIAAPVEEVAEAVVAPVEETAEAVVAPVEETAEKTAETVATLTEETAENVETAAENVEAVAERVADTVEQAEDTVKQVEDTAEQIEEAATRALESAAEPIEDTAQASESAEDASQAAEPVVEPVAQDSISAEPITDATVEPAAPVTEVIPEEAVTVVDSKAEKKALKQAAREEKAKRPAGVAAYYGFIILFMIPIIGFIAAIICAFVPNNKGLKNFARAALLYFLIGLALFAVLFIVLIFAIKPILQTIATNLLDPAIAAKTIADTIVRFFNTLH